MPFSRCSGEYRHAERTLEQVKRHRRNGKPRTISRRYREHRKRLHCHVDKDHVDLGLGGKRHQRSADEGERNKPHGFGELAFRLERLGKRTSLGSNHVLILRKVVNPTNSRL